MEYILRNVPSYEMANEQLNQVSQRWEKEVNELSKEAETMYKNYQVGHGVSHRRPEKET